MTGRLARALAALIAALFASACGHSSEPSATGTTGGTPPATTVPCEAGGPCSPEGSMCTPIPIGSDWSHAYVCSGGRWSDLEIAPLPQPQPPPPMPASDGVDAWAPACAADSDCVMVFSFPPDCCNGCGGRAVTHVEAAEIGRACAGRGGAASCPFTECPELPEALCVDGACESSGNPRLLPR